MNALLLCFTCTILCFTCTILCMRYILYTGNVICSTGYQADIECDCCNINTIEFNIGISTVVIIYGGDTLIVAHYFFFFSDHFVVVDNLYMHHLNSNSIL